MDNMLTGGIGRLWRSDRARFLIIAGICGMVAVNQTGTGILSAVIPVKLAADGYPAAAAGIISTTFSIAFVAGCVMAPQAIRAIGAERVALLAAAINATLALLHWLVPGGASWALLRGVGGVSAAIYFVLVESWLASQSPPGARGMVFGIYMVLNRLAFAVGQLSLALFAPETLPYLFCIASLVYLAAPTLRPRGTIELPPLSNPSLAGLLEVPRRAPAACAACLLHGLVFASVPGLLPKWGVDSGITVTAIGQGLAALQIGGVFLQLPVSYASDRFERRTVMAGVALMTGALSLLVLYVSPDTRWLWASLLFLWGGLASTLYSLAAAHAGDLAPPEKRVAWVSSIMLIWGTGAAVGPLVASLLMDSAGSSRLWSYAAVTCAATGLFLIWRKIVRP